MKSILVGFVTLVCLNAKAQNTKVMFHPYDETMVEIAKTFDLAKESIDMALYNIDKSDQNPVIKWLMAPENQKRIQSGELKVRLIFEGFEDKNTVKKKMAFFENIGVDVKTLNSGRKMHHKFAVIDGKTNRPVLITGSANWSMMSRRQFNENLIFFFEQPHLAQKFQKEFQLLWYTAPEYGFSVNYNDNLPALAPPPAPGIESYFNSDNFSFKDGKISKKYGSKGYVLTRKIVAAIDSAKNKIEIATTRIKLRPIYNALLRAAKRGVKIEVVVTMESYKYIWRRNKLKMKECKDEYQRACSTSQDFAMFLFKSEYPGKENVSVRVKFFNVKLDGYLIRQMHSKYIIVDDALLLTGSFNWSYSAEYNHIENVIAIDGNLNAQILEDFNMDFDRLWNLNRETKKNLIANWTAEIQKDKKIKCSFAPIVMSYLEIDDLLATGKRAGGFSNLRKHCK